MLTQTQRWIEKIKQQLAAESYLDNLSYEEIDILTDRLLLGTNNYRLYSTATEVKGILEIPEIEHPTRMLESQADKFLEDFEIIHHLPNRSSGFSATLTRNIATGEYTLSFRSTEFRKEINGGDRRRDGTGGADSEISLNGFALGQLMQMQDYYDWLISSNIPIDASAKLDVTGYSLGGQLATAFTILHADIVNHAYIFNGVGIGDFAGKYDSLGQMIEDYRTALHQQANDLGESLQADIFDINAKIQLVPEENNKTLPSLYDKQSHVNASRFIFDQYDTSGARPMLGGTDTLETLPDEFSAKISQIYGHARHNDTEIVANQGINSSNEYAVFIEDQPDWIGDGNVFGLGGDFGDTHNFILVLDSLAVTEVFQMLDESLDRKQVEDILAASSPAYASDSFVEHNSLENALDALRQIILGPNVDKTPTDDKPDSFGEITFRQGFYENISALKTEIADLNNTVPNIQIKPLVSTDMSELIDLALDKEAGLAYRYALYHLNPFVVTGNETIYQQHDLSMYSLFDPVTGQGFMTDKYLRDRAALLSVKNQVYLADLPEHEISGLQSLELESPLQQEQQSLEVKGIQDLGQDKIIFESADGQIIEGAAGDDHLFAALDKENDVLIGGEGDDYLEGGYGSDIYIYNDGDGFDHILDTDGDGQINFNGNVLTGGDQVAENFYQSEDKQFTYLFAAEAGQAGTLVINNSVKVENYNNGDLGIWLQPLQKANIASKLEVSATDAKDFYLLHDKASYLEGLAGSDLLSASSFNDDLFGNGGNDWLYGNAGDDYLSGGDGNDFLLTGSGSNIVDGDLGNDIVVSHLSVSKNTDGNQFHEKRFWLDLGDKMQVSSADELYLTEENYFAFKIDINLPQIDLAGLSYDGLYQYQYDHENKKLFYLDAQDVPQLELNIEPWFNSIDSVDGSIFSGGNGGDVLIGNAGEDYFFGGEDNDRLAGNESDDVLLGGHGDDQVLGGKGDDLILGGHDDDLLIGESGLDRIFGGNGNDTIMGDQGFLDKSEHDADKLYGEKGDDVLSGQGGNDLLNGGDGEDTLLAGEGNDQVYGGAGNDFLQGDNGNDYLNAGLGNDQLFGDAGNDLLEGQGGDDYLYGGDGVDTLTGGIGNDHLFGEEGADRYIVNIGDQNNIIHDSSSGNALIFGYGIGRERVSLDYEPGLSADLTITYGPKDKVTIKNYFSSQFNSVEFLDEGGVSRPFSYLFKPYMPYVIESKPNDLFFISDSNVEDAFLLKIEQSELGNYLQSGDIRQNQLQKQNYLNNINTYLSDKFDQFSFIKNKNGLYEKIPNPSAIYPMIEYSDGVRHFQEVAGDWTRTVKNMTGSFQDAGQKQILQTELVPVVTPVIHQVDYPSLLGDAYRGNTKLSTYTTYEEVQKTVTVNYQSILKTVHQYYVLGSELDDQIDLGSTYFNEVHAGAGDDVIKSDISDNRYSSYFGARAYMPFGNDYVLNMPGNYLDGGQGNDYIEGSAWEDVLIGGSGNDILIGGGGNDTYQMSLDNGHDTLFDNGREFDGNNTKDVLVMPEDIDLEDLSFEWGTELFQEPSAWDTEEISLAELHTSLRISWAGTSSAKIIFPHMVNQANLGIDIVKFSDGSSIKLLEIPGVFDNPIITEPHASDNQLAQNFSFSGGPGNDELALGGMPVNKPLFDEEYPDPGYVPEQYPYLVGGEGKDILHGSDSDDVLVGGKLYSRGGESTVEFWGGLNDDGNVFDGNHGNDLIWATGGNDTVEYHPGDGHDRVTDMLHGHDFYVDFYWDPQFSQETLSEYQQGADALKFSGGLSPSDVEVSRSDNHLLFDVNNGAGSVLFYNWYEADFNQLKSVEFSDGTVWGDYEISRLSQGLPLNSAPEVNIQIPDLYYSNASDINHQFDHDAFIDADNNDLLSYTLSSGNKESLPDWITFDPVSFQFQANQFGIIPGEYHLTLTATDDYGDSASQSFTMIIEDDFKDTPLADSQRFGIGSGGNDRITGNDNNNYLFGSNGDDYLIGEKGNDLLMGGQGNDAYFYSRDDGNDTILDFNGRNTLVFEDIGREDVTLSKKGRNILMEINDNQGSVLLHNMFNAERRSVDQIVFENADVIPTQELDALISEMAGFNSSSSSDSSLSYLTEIDDNRFSIVVNS